MDRPHTDDRRRTDSPTRRTDSPPNHRPDAPSRRSFLALAGGAVGFAGYATVPDAQAGTFELEGGIGHWLGVAPAAIEGAENPPLELQAGRTYRVVWTNLDGFDHNFVIINGAGDEVVRSPITSERGQTQTVEFTATEDMTEYFCEVHPNSMRGEVRIAGRREAPEVPEPQIPLGSTVGLQTVAEGLTAPLAFAVAPEEADRRFVVDQTGQVYVHGPDGLRDEPFLDIADRMVELGVPRLNGYDERGLLGLAFHPDFAANRRFYVHYSAPRRAGTPPDYDHTEVVAEFTATEDLRAADPASERAVLEIPSPQMNHDGGDIEFGPDGYLYVGMGDGGAADDVGMGHVDDWYDANAGGNGQDVEANLLGSVLRIDVDGREGDRNYAIPDDNPLVGRAGLDEHFAWGFRNPRSMSFNDGELFVADAGQNLYEEVDIVERGGNYGWNVREGTHCFSTEHPTEPPANCPGSTPPDVRGGELLLDPVIEYRHRRSTTAFIDGSVVVGGYVYEGSAIPALEGRYVFGNWSGQGVVEADGELLVATPPGGGPTATPSPAGTPPESPTGTQTETPTGTVTPEGTETGTPSSGGSQQPGSLWSLEELVVAGTGDGQLNQYVMGFGRDRDGELYVLTTENFTPTGSTGQVHKLVPAGGGGTPTGTATATPTGTATETGG